MRERDWKSRLFLPLVLTVFFIIAALTIPAIIHRVSAVGQAVGTTTGGTLGMIKEQFNKAHRILSPKTLDLDIKEAKKKEPLFTDDIEKKTEGEHAVLPTVQSRVLKIIKENDPAKAYCTKGGGYIQERKGPADVNYTVCLFIDGSECEVKQFAHKECHIGQYRVAEDGMKLLSKGKK